MSEGMGSVIPIKVAEGRIFSEKLKMWDTGESCPKKVMAPQISKNSEISPPINPRKRSSKATLNKCKMKNLSIILMRMVPFRLDFLGLVEGGIHFMDEKRIYTVKELEEILMVSRPAIYELLKRKEFDWVLIGGRYRISKKSFDRWFDGDDAD